MLPPRPSPWRAVVSLPLGVLLSGCGFKPEYAWVEVHNHTDGAVVARDPCWDDWGGDQVTVPAQGVRTLEVEVHWYDADIEIDAGHAQREYDLDFAPFDSVEDLHVDVGAADFAPAGNG